MSLINFFNTLNPFTKKRDLLEKIRLIEDSLDSTIEIYSMSVELGEGELLANPPNASGMLAKAIQSSSYGKHRIEPRQLDAFLLGQLESYRGKLAIIRDVFDNSSSGDVSRDGITYHRITALAMAARISFCSEYIHRFMTVHAMGRSPAEVKWVMDQLKTFVSVLITVDITDKAFRDVLAALPDKTFTPEDHETDLAVSGSGVVDPLQFNLIGLSWNPFLYIGVKFAQRNINKMEANKADLKALRFRIAMLKDRRTGVVDAALEKELEVYEADAVALAEDIAKTERRYGIN